MILLNLIRMMI